MLTQYLEISTHGTAYEKSSAKALTTCTDIESQKRGPHQKLHRKTNRSANRGKRRPYPAGVRIEARLRDHGRVGHIPRRHHHLPRALPPRTHIAGGRRHARPPQRRRARTHLRTRTHERPPRCLPSGNAHSRGRRRCCCHCSRHLNPQIQQPKTPMRPHKPPQFSISQCNRNTGPTPLPVSSPQSALRRGGVRCETREGEITLDEGRGEGVRDQVAGE